MNCSGGRAGGLDTKVERVFLNEQPVLCKLKIYFMHIDVYNFPYTNTPSARHCKTG